MSRSNNYSLPRLLELIIKERDDLLKLNFLDIESERKLLKWLVKNGSEVYPELFKGNYKNNEIIKWLSSFSSIKGYEKIPRIIIAIWDIHPMHRKYWSNLSDESYLNWLKLNWYNLKIFLPSYLSFFKVNYNSNLFFVLITQKWINSKFFSNIFIQYNVVNALIYREIKIRIVKNNLGYIGLFTENIANLITFMIIRIIFGFNVGMNFAIFLSLGILFVTFFRKVAIVSVNVAPSYKSLSILTRVKPIDIFISLTILEQWITTILLILIIVLSYILNQSIFMNNIALLITSFLLLIIFCFSCGLLFKVLTLYFPALPKITTWFNRFIFVGSATFYSLNNLPQFIKPFLSWNPILQSIELSRWSIDKNYFIDSNYISLNYLVFCSFITLSISLTLYSFFEEEIIKR